MTTVIYRQVHCINCGDTLQHRATGRGKRFCSTKCRVAYGRAMKRHARQCVDALLAGEPEPTWKYGYPVETAQYWAYRDGTAIKRPIVHQIRGVS